jgi:hypothetical protein
VADSVMTPSITTARGGRLSNPAAKGFKFKEEQRLLDKLHVLQGNLAARDREFVERLGQYRALEQAHQRQRGAALAGDGKPPDGRELEALEKILKEIASQRDDLAEGCYQLEVKLGSTLQAVAPKRQEEINAKRGQIQGRIAEARRLLNDLENEERSLSDLARLYDRQDGMTSTLGVRLPPLVKPETRNGRGF